MSARSTLASLVGGSTRCAGSPIFGISFYQSRYSATNLSRSTIAAGTRPAGLFIGWYSCASLWEAGSRWRSFGDAGTFVARARLLRPHCHCADHKTGPLAGEDVGPRLDHNQGSRVRVLEADFLIDIDP